MVAGETEGANLTEISQKHKKNQLKLILQIVIDQMFSCESMSM